MTCDGRCTSHSYRTADPGAAIAPATVTFRDQAGCLRAEGRLRHPRVPPRAGMAEPGDHLVEAARPPHERVDLARRQELGVNIDDPPWQEGENLTAPFVEPEHPRNVLKTRAEEAEKSVNRHRPRPGGPVHRAAEPPRAAHVASQPLRLLPVAPAGITHDRSIRRQPSQRRNIAPGARYCGKWLRLPVASQARSPANVRS